MKFDLSKIKAAPVSRLKTYEYDFPYILCIPVHGDGTGGIEALSSYLCRQAELLSERAHTYTERLVKMSNIGGADKLKKKSIHGIAHACNGIGIIQNRASESIKFLSMGKIDPDRMTLKPLEFLSGRNSQGLMRDIMCWCPACWRNDVERNDTPYLRLCWTLQRSYICTIHNQRLIQFCPVCGSEKSLFPSLPIQHICDQCGHNLYELTSTQVNKLDDFTDEQSWLSHSIYNLIERVSSIENLVMEKTLPNALKRIMQAANLSASAMANLLQADQKSISELVSGKRRPHFASFLDMCYRMDIPPDQLLFEKDNMTTPDQWRTHPHTKFVIIKRLTPKQKKLILGDLRKAIKDNPSPAIRISHIASKHSVRYTTIRNIFPEEYKVLIQRRRSWESQFRKNMHQARIEQLTEGIFSLARHGIYPSERKLRDLKYVKPYDLRREDIRLLLCAFQDVYKSHGFLDD